MGPRKGFASRVPLRAWFVAGFLMRVLIGFVRELIR